MEGTIGFSTSNMSTYVLATCYNRSLRPIVIGLKKRRLRLTFHEFNCLSFPLICYISSDLMCGCDHHCGVPARPSVPLTPTSYSFLSTFHLPAFSMVCHLLQLLTDVIDSIRNSFDDFMNVQIKIEYYVSR